MIQPDRDCKFTLLHKKGAERIGDAMTVGTKWGFLKCVGLESQVLEDAGGAVQEVISSGRGTIWRLRCQCGNEVETDFARFPGRKKMRSCGMEGCPYTKEADGGGGNGGEGEYKPMGRPMKPGGRKAPMMLYVSLDMMAELGALARRQGVSLSELVREILGEWMKDRGERVRKKGEQS